MTSSLHTALTLAMREGLAAQGTTSPNPPVGAVIVDAQGRVLGTGHTQPVGGPHAEVMALRAAGDKARGATAVITLEPCAHTGRTGPCTTALIDAGIARVYYLHPDPNPVAAGGATVLARAGIETQRIGASEAEKTYTRDALSAWLAAVRLGRAHVTVKFAQTLDGFTAAADGTSQWITGPAARTLVHSDRARRDAIIVGTGTVLADNPSLTARNESGELYPQQPRRVVIGSRDIKGFGRASQNLQNLGCEQYPSPHEALRALYDSGARDVLVEGGASLTRAFFAAGLVDRIQAYIAPTLLGAGRGVVDAALAGTLSEASRWQFDHVQQVGTDLLVELVPARHS